MHKNTFLATPDVKKSFFNGGLEMHQNTFLTIPEVKKLFFFT